MKRSFDFAASFFAIIVLSPLLLVLAAMVRIMLGSPVLFSQQRLGLHGKPFKIFKFRTMIDKRDSSGELLPDSERLTSFGRFLRGSSLDELPELFNVLKGEMSLVGPRPLLVQYRDRYTPEQWRRHEVRPGITGLAQVNGRQHVLFSKRLEFDVWYVDHQSLVLDLRILFMTIRRVLNSEGVKSGQDVREVDDLGLYVPPSSEANGKKEEIR